MTLKLRLTLLVLWSKVQSPQIPAVSSSVLRKGLAGTMSPSRTAQKPVTPDSVKALMIIEAIVVAFFSFWLANEYVYNVFFRIYVNSIFVEHLTTYTIGLGLGIGLAGTAVAAALYKNLREAKVRLEAAAPKIKGSIEKMLASVPTMEAQAHVPSTSPVPASQAATETVTTSDTPPPPTSTLPSAEEKK